MTVEEFNRKRKYLQNQVMQAAQELMEHVQGSAEVRLSGDVDIVITPKRGPSGRVYRTKPRGCYFDDEPSEKRREVEDAD